MKKLTEPENCAWCGNTTNLPPVYAAKVPILEEVEETINMFCKKRGIDRSLIWGENANWDEVNLPPGFDSMLLAYDDLCNDAEKRVICGDCLLEDNVLWLRYYDNKSSDEIIQSWKDELDEE